MAGDELAPSNGTPGGAYYKFIPAQPWAGGDPVTTLDQSPLVGGTVKVLKVGQGSNTGQAMAQGDAIWLPVSPDPASGSLRAEWTSGIFDATGEHFYVSVQHNVTGFGVVLDITGWR